MLPVDGGDIAEADIGGHGQQAQLLHPVPFAVKGKGVKGIGALAEADRQVAVEGPDGGGDLVEARRRGIWP